MTDIDLDKLEARLKSAKDGQAYRSVRHRFHTYQVREDDINSAISLIASAREAAAEIERLRSALGAAEGRATDYRTVAINQGWNWSLCDTYGREEYAKHRGEHVDACALNAAEARARGGTNGLPMGS